MWILPKFHRRAFVLALLPPRLFLPDSGPLVPFPATRFRTPINRPRVCAILYQPATVQITVSRHFIPLSSSTPHSHLIYRVVNPPCFLSDLSDLNATELIYLLSRLHLRSYNSATSILCIPRRHFGFSTVGVVPSPSPRSLLIYQTLTTACSPAATNILL